MKKIILFILFTVSLLQAQNDILLLYDSGGIDTIPSQFNFVDVTNAALSTMDTSLAVTLTGFDSAWCYAAGQSFAVNAGAFRTAGIKVYRNDIVYVRRTSSASYNTAVTVVLTVGGKSDTWSLTTGMWWTFVASNVSGTETGENQLTFTGDTTNTPTTKALGSLTCSPYIRWWIDSTDIILNGTFGDDAEWVVGTDWAISGGKANYDGSGTTVLEDTINYGSNVSQNMTLAYTVSGTTGMKLGINEITFSPFGARVLLAETTHTNGTYRVSFSSYGNKKIQFSPNTSNSGSLDNITLYNTVDSVAGLTKVLSDVSNSANYYYSQALTYITGAGDTVYSVADVDTILYDSTPDQFAFTDVTLAEFSTSYQDSMIVDDIDVVSAVSITGTGGTYRKGALGSWTAVAGTVVEGDTVWVRNTSSDECLTGKNTTLTIGGVLIYSLSLLNLIYLLCLTLRMIFLLTVKVRK